MQDENDHLLNSNRQDFEDVDEELDEEQLMAQAILASQQDNPFDSEHNETSQSKNDHTASIL